MAAQGDAVSFTAGAALDGDGAPILVALADVTGDGKIDAISAPNRGTAVRVHVGDGAGGFSASRHVATLATEFA